MTTSDLIQLGMAVITAIAAGISLYAVRVSTKQNTDINNSVLKQNELMNSSSLLSVYYEKIFSKYLTEKIPEARRKLRFNDGKLEVPPEFIQTFNKMIQDAVFFKYQNNSFYRELKLKIDNLELYVTGIVNQTIVDDSDEGTIKEEINNRISDIYKLITKSLTNTK